MKKAQKYCCCSIFSCTLLMNFNCHHLVYVFFSRFFYFLDQSVNFVIVCKLDNLWVLSPFQAFNDILLLSECPFYVKWSVCHSTNVFINSKRGLRWHRRLLFAFHSAQCVSTVHCLPVTLPAKASFIYFLKQEFSFCMRLSIQSDCIQC